MAIAIYLQTQFSQECSLKHIVMNSPRVVGAEHPKKSQTPSKAGKLSSVGQTLPLHMFRRSIIPIKRQTGISSIVLQGSSHASEWEGLNFCSRCQVASKNKISLARNLAKEIQPGLQIKYIAPIQKVEYVGRVGVGCHICPLVFN